MASQRFIQSVAFNRTEYEFARRVISSGSATTMGGVFHLAMESLMHAREPAPPTLDLAGLIDAAQKVIDKARQLQAERAAQHGVSTSPDRPL